MPVGTIDKLGNNYGGTSFNQSGVGDRVLDVNSTVATVLAMVFTPTGTFVDVLTDTMADGNRHEARLRANALQITSHQDGTGLVSGGAATSFPALSPPMSDNLIQKAF